MSFCSICTGHSGDGSHGDGPVLTCTRCGVQVHAVCHGGWHAIDAAVQNTPWECDYCDLSPYLSCNLCSRSGGTMTVAADGGFAHVACALWIPEAGYDPLAAVCTGTSRSNAVRNALQCVFCGGKGGATQCASPRCLRAMHASCMLSRLRAAGGTGAGPVDGSADGPGRRHHMAGPPAHALPAVLPIVLNVGLELFCFCPKHGAAYGGPRRQYALLKAKIAEAMNSQTPAGAAVGARSTHSEEPQGAFSTLFSSLGPLSAPDMGVWDPDTTSSLAYRIKSGPAPTGDTQAELLRAAQEQTAFLRDVVQPHFGAEDDDGPTRLPLQILVGALRTHMAPVMAVTAASTTPGSKDKMPHEELHGAELSRLVHESNARRDLLASLALSSSALDAIVDGEPAWRTMSDGQVGWRAGIDMLEGENALVVKDKESFVDDEHASKRQRIGENVTNNAIKPIVAQDSTGETKDRETDEDDESSSSDSSDTPRKWPTGPSTWAFAEEAEQLHAHLGLQRHITNTRLLQLVARVQSQDPAALPPGLQLLDDDIAKVFAGEYVGPDKRAEAGAISGASAQPGENLLGSSVQLVAYRGSTQPWQGPVPVVADPAPSLANSPFFSIPNVDPVHDMLARSVTSDFRVWKGIVAHFHAGLSDRTNDKAWVPPSWLIQTQGRDANASASSTSAAAHPLHTSCGVCMDDRETVTDEMLRCTACNKVVVHKLCYGVPDARKATFKCDVCRHGGGKVTPVCCMCGNIGGPVKLTRQAQWVHVTCALLSGPTWMPLRTMGPVVVDVHAARAAQQRCAERLSTLSRALCGPPSAMVAAVGGPAAWRMLRVALQRVELYKMPNRPAPEVIPNFDFVAQREVFVNRNPPPVAAPTLVEGARHGFCAVCRRPDGRLQPCVGAVCGYLFHPMCAWLDGQYVVAASTEAAAASRRGTGLLGELGPSLACDMHCPQHLPAHVKDRDVRKQRVMRAGQGFQLRKPA